MFTWLSSRNRDAAKAGELYGRVVAAARDPAIYRRCGVADTPEGRYEMIVLHLFLAFERLNREGEPGQRLGRLAAEAFVQDMDDSFREMGVGDLGVPKKVKRAAAGLYERFKSYGAVVEADDAELARVLADNVPGLSGRADMAGELADRVRHTREHLRQLPAGDILQGKVSFAARAGASPPQS